MLNSFGDVFELRNKREQILELERMGNKKVDNLLAGIEEAKSRGLDRVLSGLGVRHVGSTVSKILAKHYRSIDAMRAATEEDIRTFQVNGQESGIGPEIAASLHHFLQSEAGKTVIDELRVANVTLEVAHRKKIPLNRSSPAKRSWSRGNSKSTPATKSTLSSKSSVANRPAASRRKPTTW